MLLERADFVERGEESSDRIGKIARPTFEGNNANNDLLHVQEIIDHPRQMIRLALDGLTGVACSFIRATKLTQHAKGRDDRGKWSAKFVAEDGQEVVFRPVGRLGFGRCTFEGVFPHRQLGILTLALPNQIATLGSGTGTPPPSVF